MNYPRDIESEIETYLACKQALFILGARQVGKTTLLKTMKEKLPDDQTRYYDLERLSDRRSIEAGPEEFMKSLTLEGLDLSRRNTIFIDEIQYFDDFSNFVKVLVDHYSDSVKLILSGSSAAQIKMRFKDSLAGRKYIFHLYPLSLREFLRFKGKSIWAEQLTGGFFQVKSDALFPVKDELLDLLKEFILFGAYPEVVKLPTGKQKIKYLNEILDAYVLKDIRTLFTIGNIDRFNHLLRYLAVNIGSLFAVNSAATEIGISRTTVENYLNILEDTFILQRLHPYHSNRTTELKKASKPYFLDNGLRNALVQNFNPLELRNDRGALIENHVFCQLWKKMSDTDRIHFWRTSHKQEVDFVLCSNDKLYPLEVKTSRTTHKHLESFFERYHCESGYITSLQTELDLSGKRKTIPLYLI